MYWNYRVFEHPQPDPDDNYTTVHEVYYDEGGKPTGLIFSPSTPHSKVDCEMLAKAFDKPVAGTLDDARRTLDIHGTYDYKDWSWSEHAAEAPRT